MTNERTIWRISLGGFFLFWALGLLIGAFLMQRSYEQQRQTIAALATEKANSMQNLLDGIMQRTYLLARLAIDDATGDVVFFQRVAESLRQDASMLSLQLAPGGTVQYSLPPQPHPRSHINLFERPERREEALRALNSRKITFSGPLQLTQGYAGFIVRRPVYRRWNPQEFWGFSIVVFSLKDFLDYINIVSLPQAGMVFSLYRQDADGRKSLIDGVPPEKISSPVSAQVNLPQCTLTLSLMPAGGWSFGARIAVVVTVALLAALVLTALLRAWFTLAQQKRSLENLVDLDPLTNLRNRRSLHSSIERRCRAGKPFALLYIDLNKFKNINDTYGHQMGDSFLLGFVQRVLPCLSGADVMFRLGGDEFLIVCPHAVLRQRLTDMEAALRAPLEVNGLPLPCFYSVGIAVYPEDGLQPETLLQCADERMYEDKKRRQDAG